MSMVKSKIITSHQNMKGVFVYLLSRLPPLHLGIGEKCGYKILIVLVVVMIAISYVAWFVVI